MMALDTCSLGDECIFQEWKYLLRATSQELIEIGLSSREYQKFTEMLDYTLPMRTFKHLNVKRCPKNVIIQRMQESGRKLMYH
jgi:hypothetical protein